MQSAIPALTKVAEESGVWLKGSLKVSVQKALSQITGKPDAYPTSEYELFYRGSQLTAERAAELEAKLQQNPKDLDSRLQLIGYHIAIVVRFEAPPAAVIQSARQKQEALVAELSQHHSKQQSEAIAVRRDLYFAEQIFRRGDLDPAEVAMELALKRFDGLLKTSPDLAKDAKTLNEGLWGIMVWQKIYQLKNQIPAKEFPLKPLWEKEAARVPRIQQDFNQVYGPST